MKFAPVLKLLSERAGLDPASLGSAAVRSAVSVRLRACGLEPDAYAARLAADPAEFLALLDEVVVPETWFFRGGTLFYHLAEQIRLARRAPFRALSLPCSTGEEPYSLAIALQEIGLPLTSCVIDGVDVSPRNVAAAQEGIYAELSFRQTDPSIRARHFRPVEGGWQIAESLRQGVRFAVGNVLDPGLLLLEHSYDLVFCRNLFIYLTPVARQQALATLARLVTPGGLLSLGHAEPLDPEDARFRRTGPEGLFLYRRTAVRASGGRKPPESLHPASGGRQPPEGAAFAEAPPPQGVDTPRSPTKTQGVDTPRSPEKQTRDALLAQARQQADSGQLADALELCQAIQTRFGPSADLNCLCGIIHQARQDRPAASAAFRKALYLEPNHREALMHLMLLCQQHGDHKQAALLRKRLEKLPSATPEGGD